MRLEYNKADNTYHVFDERGHIATIHNEEAKLEFESMMIKAEDLGVCLSDVVDILKEAQLDLDHTKNNLMNCEKEVSDLREAIEDLRCFMIKLFDEIETWQGDYNELLNRLI